MRLHIYNIVKSAVYEKYEQDFCSVNTVKFLNDSCEDCKDQLDKPFYLWDTVSQDLLSIDNIIYLNKLRQVPLLGRLASGQISSMFLNTYEKLSVVVMVLT